MWRVATMLKSKVPGNYLKLLRIKNNPAKWQIQYPHLLNGFFYTPSISN